jgi:hypothetical protein
VRYQWRTSVFRRPQLMFSSSSRESGSRVFVLECFHEKAIVRQGQRGGLRLPAPSHSSARLPFALLVSRSIRLGACWGPASSGAAISPRTRLVWCGPHPPLIKHSSAVARTGRSGMGSCRCSGRRPLARQRRGSAQRFVRLTGDPEPVQEHSELACYRNHGALLGGFSSSLRQAQSPAA